MLLSLPLILALRPLPREEEALAFSSFHSDLEIDNSLILQSFNQTTSHVSWWDRLKEWVKLRF